MRFQNKKTGDVCEMPPPDHLGRAFVKFNGRIVHWVTYSDEDGGTTTTEQGQVFHGDEWAYYLIDQLKTGTWKSLPTVRVNGAFN